MSKINLTKVAAPLAAAAVSLSLMATPAAGAQTLPAAPSVEQMSSQIQIGKFLGLSEEQAWAQRNDLIKQIKTINNPQVIPVLEQAVDNTVNAVFPGLVARKNAEIRAEQERLEREHAAQVAREQAAAQEAARIAEEQRKRNEFDRGPCPRDADACVDIDRNRSWLQDDNGNVTHVAEWISSGARTPGLATPRGAFNVQYKVKDEVSREFGNAPMPYAIYFTNTGHAFHEGSPAYDSHGCIHLQHQDAVAYWNDLQVGDKVFIF
ncbi:L,D-transpeptidase [Corynebacterium phoceense]|uniref:L,D-transpeptidase n=1 Tax=Corynebacterium phoceense TaxID=1686286 RepID=UPI00211C8317|nr:L,D-transpeptidase [Corynebacterium phoceense]MCQ9331219.1 L,D-transpeptidase [Corynebacterium phoceense]MCQ9347617.1 L,D-transpeptidase [Corynebacterium phoceense]